MSKNTLTGTRRVPLNTKIEPSNEDPKKFNVEKVTNVKPYNNKILAKLDDNYNIYRKLVLLLKLDTQVYYNLRIILSYETM